MADVYASDLGSTVKVGRVWANNAGAPGVTNDQAHGYRLGDTWLTLGNAVYVCTADAPAGAAHWTQTG